MNKLIVSIDTSTKNLGSVPEDTSIGKCIMDLKPVVIALMEGVDKLTKWIMWVGE